MVRSTRARRYDFATSSHDHSIERPTKRRLVQVQPAECNPTFTDRIWDDLARHHDPGISDHMCMRTRTHTHQTGLDSAELNLAEQAPSVSRLPSLCRSTSSVSEDDISQRRNPQHALLSTDAILDPSRISNGLGDVRSAEGKAREELDKKHIQVQQATEHARSFREETDRKQDEQLRSSTTPAMTERDGMKEEHPDHKGETPQALWVSREAAACLQSCDQVQSPGPSVPPPTAPCTPPEHVYEDVVNHDFSRELDIAFTVSVLRDGYRRYKYGADVSERWKRGSTPEEARERWRLTAAKHRAEAEEYSDSE